MGALEGIKILDLSEKLTVSLGTMYLAQYGAEVTKVEKPGQGDKTRTWEPVMDAGSLYFNYLNSNKQSITLEITTEKGAEILKKLVAEYDVICVDTEAGYMDSLGLGYDDIKAIKDDIIYACCSYYGETGPYKNKPASSLTMQAKGVAMDMTGVVDQYPVQSGPSISQHYAAAYLATGVVLAAIDKKTRGIGQKIDIALLDSIISCIEAAPAAISSVGEIQRRKGNFDPSCAPYDTFATSDGYVSIGIATQAQWLTFCDAMGFEDLKNDPRFLTMADRVDDYMNKLLPVMAEKLAPYTKGEVEAKCREVGVPCCAVLNVREITDLPNTLENEYMIETTTARFGKLRYPSIPFALSKTKAKAFVDAPALGEDTEDILKTIGIEDEAQEVLKSENII